jgi:hypothetical protein
VRSRGRNEDRDRVAGLLPQATQLCVEYPVRSTKRLCDLPGRSFVEGGVGRHQMIGEGMLEPVRCDEDTGRDPPRPFEQLRERVRPLQDVSLRLVDQW